MSDPVLEIPHHLDPDEPRIEWRRLSRQIAVWALWVAAMVVAFRLLDQAFDGEGEDGPGLFEFVYGTSVQCIRTSSELGLVGGQPRLVPEEGALFLGPCDQLGLVSSTEPITHPNGRRYIDTYRTEYYVRTAQFEIVEGQSEYGSEEGMPLLRIVDEACYEHYARLAPYTGSWNGCPADSRNPSP